MKKLLAAVVVGLVGSVSAGTIYVKPNGTGDGSSWAAATGLESAIAAAKESGTSTSLYLSEGVYYPSDMLHIGSGIALYGGFAGISMDETPEARDIAAHPTIISGDTKKNDRWELFDALHGTSSDSGELIIQNGKIFVPQFANDYDTVAPLQSTVSYSADNLVRVISIAVGSDASCVVDGVTVQGGGWTVGRYANRDEDGWSCDYGGAIFVGEGASPVVRNCRIVGCYGMRSVVYFHGSKDSKSTPVFENNAIEYCRTAYWGGLTTYGANVALTLKDCAFTGNVRATGQSDAYGAAAVYMANGMRLDGCVFTRNYNWHTRSNASSSICISAGYAVTSFISDCRFENNSSYATVGEAVPVINYAWHSHSLARCQFLGNRAVVNASAATVQGASCLYTVKPRTFVENCVFAGNVVEAGSSVSGAMVVAATAIANGTEADLVFANCIFKDNTAEAVADDGVAKASRGVLAWGTGVAPKVMAVLCQCTAVGSSSAPDLVYCGSDDAAFRSTVVNSVLWSDADGARVETTAGNPVDVKSSIVRDASRLTGPIAVSDTVEYDPEIVVQTVAGVPYPMIGKRDPGNKAAYDVATFGYYGTPIFAYAPKGSADWVEFHGYGGGTKVLLPDIKGVSRQASDFTKGALQELSPIAVKYTFDLGNRGTFEDGSSVVTLDLFTGDAVEVPAFTVADGYTLRKWRGSLPTRAGDRDAIFRAYYWGPIIEIDGGDDLAEVLAYAKSLEDGAEIQAGAGDYEIADALAIPAKVELKGFDGARVVATSKYAIDNSSLNQGTTPTAISGVTFTGGGVWAGQNCPMSFTDCIFTNATANGSEAAVYTKGVLSLTSCTVVDNTVGVYTPGLVAQTPVSIVETVFRANRAKSEGSAIAGAQAWITIDGCVFEANTNSVRKNLNGIVGSKDEGALFITNSKFVNNVAIDAMDIVFFPNYNPSWVSNCLFYANQVIGDRGNDNANEASVLNARRKYHGIYNTAFVANRVVRTEAATKDGVLLSRGSVVYSDYFPKMWNNTFLDNRVTVSATSEAVTTYAAVCTFGGGAGPFANMTFKDNVAADGDLLLGKDSINVYNSILTGGTGHCAVSRAAGVTAIAKFINSYAKDAPTWATQTQCLQTEPVFESGLTERNDAVALRLAPGSSGRRGGIRVYRVDTDAVLAYQDGTSWKRCDNQGTKELAEPYVLLADAFGDLPKESHVVMGAVQEYERGGLLLLFR